MDSSSDLDVDSSILKQVEKAINRVATVQQDSDFNVSDDDGIIQDSEISAERVAEILNTRHRELESQKASLESEILHLQEQITRQEASNGELLDLEIQTAILSLVGGDEGSGDKVAALSKEELLSRLVGKGGEGNEDDESLSQLKSQIKLSEAFSGIKFKSVNWEIKHTDDSGLLREHIHIGTALDYDFKVVFLAREEKGEDSGTYDLAKIVELQVEVDPRARRDMEQFLAMVSMDFDLMSFYQTYMKYCLHRKERTDAFKVAKEKLLEYDENAHFTEGSAGYRLRFSNHEGMKLVLNWDVNVSIQGAVDHSLKLQFNTPSNVSDEIREALSRLHPLLDKMILAYGHREGFLQMLTLFEPPDET